MPEIAIRDATSEDATFLARISLIATRAPYDWGIYDVLLGLPDDALLGRLERMALAESPSFHHFSRRLVATVDGVAAASLSGFEGGPASLTDLSGAVAASLSPEELQQMAANRAPVSTCLFEPEDGAWVVELVGTLPEHRRLGLMGRLLEEALERGRKAGFRRSNIQVEIGNDPAIRAYERAGFEIIAEKRHPDFEAVMRTPGLYLMSRSLDPL